MLKRKESGSTGGLRFCTGDKIQILNIIHSYTDFNGTSYQADIKFNRVVYKDVYIGGHYWERLSIKNKVGGVIVG